MSVTIDKTPPRIPIITYAGDAFHQTFGLRDADGYTDTSDWTGRMKIKAHKDDPAALLDSGAGEIVLTFGVQGTPPDQWNIEMFISSTNMSKPALRGLVGWYDLEVTDTSGRPVTAFGGPFCVEGDVT